MYHRSPPRGSVQRCASMVCRKPGERCDLGSSRKSKPEPDWLLHMQQATPPGRTGRRKHPSSEHGKTDPIINTLSRDIDLMSNCGDVSHHLAKNDDFWSQLFVNGKYVNETESEDHVVHTQEIPTKLIRPIKHPAKETKCTAVTAPPSGQPAT